ncbi:MAG: dockerin type I repeat-containing protein [Ruminococcus sp.]|nr:dockerin type I repeat-containing protein [Ruminococcus sp.]
MKCLVIGLALNMISGATSSNVGSNSVFTTNGDVSWSQTVISGDANKDGAVSIADAIILQKYLDNNTDSCDNLDFSCLDMNCDGVIDVFDMVIMRQSIINPENITSRTYSVDIMKSSENPVQPEKIIANTDELSFYLSEIMTDSAEIQSYLDRYDSTFFEDNNLVLATFIQERGRGVYYNVSGTGRNTVNQNARSAGMPSEEIYLTISAKYDNYRPLYPLTNTPLLIQATVPKSFSNDDSISYCFDMNEDVSNTTSHIYLSPDGSKELTITQETLGDFSDIRVFVRTSKISYRALTFLIGYGNKPFTDDGEWQDNVFTNGSTYSITWLDDSIILDHQIEGNEWEKVLVSFDGSTVKSEYYTK